MAIERIVPGTKDWEAWYANHISRYQFAAEKLLPINEPVVLDAACGVGYGSAFLSQKLPKSQLFGIDRSTEALTIAKNQFQYEHVRFLQDDCHTLEKVSFSGPFDAVVSFETLEHLPKPDDFISACKRNLKRGGVLILSTPNQPFSSPEGLTWEFHEKEYTAKELVDLLGKHGFSSVEIYGQKFTAIGKLRYEIRRDFNRLHSNPFARIGSFIQRFLRGVKFPAILPEQPEDIEIVRYSDINIIESEGQNGPFVLIAVCRV